MKFIEIHSLDSDKDIIINARYIAEIEDTAYGSNLWLTTEAGMMRMIRTTTPYHQWTLILDTF